MKLHVMNAGSDLSTCLRQNLRGDKSWSNNQLMGIARKKFLKDNENW